ncbi:hypothetical protein N7537_006702 [Penicillium hordei]|uniref:Neutral metalloproteinase n=1 Tax=Penicillium hordei TaxID=40994 RepID=A0AAD6H291_9EURO|nr:uncharacterized protein N7537_006702 [Penicillium hordei]KAJ5603746.1 hypothetical protein N7537_006702 [Penicillium hordei]
MSAICSIVPDHILESIVEKGEAPPHVIDSCQATIAKTRELRDARIEHGQSVASIVGQEPPQGIIPSYIHEAIARYAASQGQFSGAVKNLNRTVYHAQNQTNERKLPRDVILIKEGGDLIKREKDLSGDPNECYVGFQKTYDFYFEFFKRNSIDNRGLQLDGFVHFGTKYLNAFWANDKMVFGDGDGVIFNGFTDELDVIGHELTHGVVEYSGGLEYYDQSGALNESIADTAAEANWLIGEGIWAKGVNGRALRDMKAPGTAYSDRRVGSDSQPAHWKDFKRLPRSDDGGGVHSNSGIPNHAFYLAATLIGGYSWETAGPVWYKALTGGELRPNASFKEFADLTIINAGEHEADIREAWMQVGYPF